MPGPESTQPNTDVGNGGDQPSLMQDGTPDNSLMGKEGSDVKDGSLMSDGDQKPDDQAGDQKPADQGDPDGSKDGKEGEGDGEGEEGKGAPEQYGDFTLPEGMEMDTPMLQSFSDAAKELDLPQEGAQKLVDLYVSKMTELAEQSAQQMAEMRLQWRNEVRQDPKHEETLGFAKRAVNRFAVDKAAGAKELLSGNNWMGDNPQIISFLANIGRAISEDTFVEGIGGGGNTRPTDAASVLYPEQNKG